MRSMDLEKIHQSISSLCILLRVLMIKTQITGPIFCYSSHRTRYTAITLSCDFIVHALLNINAKKLSVPT